jgi:hypothetical protein
MYVRKSVICEHANTGERIIMIGTRERWDFYYEQRLDNIFLGDSVQTSNLSHVECVMSTCMQRNGHSFTIFLGEPDF